MRRIHPQPEYDGDLWKYKGRFYTYADISGELVEIAPEGTRPVLLLYRGETGWFWYNTNDKANDSSEKATGKEPECGQG